MKRNHHSLWILLLMHVVIANADESSVLSVEKVLKLAEKNSKSITVETYNELVAHNAIDVAKSTYFPTLGFEAIDTTGFPGSSNISGMRGLTNSPFRKGASAGLELEQIIWDFGRTTNEVKTAEHKEQYAKETTKITAYKVQAMALETFYHCSLYKTQHKLWKKFVDEALVINNEALRFVNTGQRSVVDKYIALSQTESARTTAAYFESLVAGSMKELSVIMGIPASEFSCPFLDTHVESPFESTVNINNSPYVARAKVGASIAEAELSRQKANFMPEIVLVGSVGAMESTNISSIEKEDYAVGVAVKLPLYNKRFSGKIKEAEAELLAKHQEIEAQKQYLDEMNASYDEKINATTVRLNHLFEERKIAEEGYALAKKRYFSLEADLLDVRTTYQILANVENEVGIVQTQLLQAKGEKALLNGASLESH